MLTDEQINKLLEKHCYAPMPSAFELCRAIEAAVRAELAGQEPVGYFSKTEPSSYHEEIWEEVTGPEFGQPLFAAPVVQPDDLKDAARYRWLTECKQVPWSRFLNDAHEFGIDAAIDTAMAAEKEQACQS